MSINKQKLESEKFNLNNLKILKIQNKSNFTPNKLNPSQNPALDFLQGQLTIDIKNLEENNLALAAHCNLKGRVESLFYILKSNNIFYLIISADIIDHAKTKLMFFGRFSPITFEIISPEINFIINNTNNKNNKNNIYPIINSKILNLYLEINFNNTNPENKENSINNSNINDSLLWEYYQLINHIPYLTKNTIGKYLPSELGLTDTLSAVDFKKGCFTGQEVIARMHYLGKSKKEVIFIDLKALNHTLETNLQILHGEIIYLNKLSIGEIICITQTQNKDLKNTNNFLSMALIKKDQAQQLDNIKIDIQDQTFTT